MVRVTRFRPRFGRFLAIVVFLLCTVLLGQALIVGANEAWYTIAPLAFAAAGVWALFWQPSVEVDPETVTVHNILRSVRVPWARLRGVDTRYALTLELDSGQKVSAWAAPAPGAAYALRLDKRRLGNLPANTYLDGTARAGDDEGTDSGLVGLVIRREWERRIDEPDTGATVETTWHVTTAIVLSALAAASVASVLLMRLA